MSNANKVKIEAVLELLRSRPSDMASMIKGGDLCRDLNDAEANEVLMVVNTEKLPAPYTLYFNYTTQQYRSF